MVSDPVRDRIYVAVAAGAPAHANSIVAFDPSAGTVIAGLPVTANPDTLAISDDGTTLWVGLHDASSVLKLDVSADVPSVAAEYPLLPADAPPYPYHAGPMVVLPGTTSSLAVSLHYDTPSPSFAGVVVLDEGSARPLRLPSQSGASRLTRGPEGFLLGFDNTTTGFGVYSISVSPDGLTQTQHPDLISGFDTDIVYDTNLLFATDGAVVRVDNPELPQAWGKLPVSGALFPDVAAGVIWVLQGNRLPAEVAAPSLLQVNLSTLEVQSSITYSTPVLAPRSFIRSAGGVFAFIADMYNDNERSLESGVHWLSFQEVG